MIDIEQIKETLTQHGYEYKDTIAQDDSSSILLCHCLKNNYDFAIKRKETNGFTQDEYNALVALHHPHITKIYDYFEDEFAQYLVVQHCTNGMIKQKEKLNYDQFIYYARQILDALAYCHSNKIAHRNIKPESIFIDQYNNAKLGDFEKAKKFMNDRTNEKCGPINYYAPEMFQGNDFCPFKADIWALGITFFYMATGKYPFSGKTKRELKQSISIGELNFGKYDVDKRIRFIILKMVQVNPSLRLSPAKLLNLSIFSQYSVDTKPSTLLDHHKCLLTTSRSMTFDIETKNSSNNESKKPTPQTSLNSCKCIKVFPIPRKTEKHIQSLKPT